jgi:hypothetical protein
LTNENPRIRQDAERRNEAGEEKKLGGGEGVWTGEVVCPSRRGQRSKGRGGQGLSALTYLPKESGCDIMSCKIFVEHSKMTCFLFICRILGLTKL